MVAVRLVLAAAPCVYLPVYDRCTSTVVIKAEVIAKTSTTIEGKPWILAKGSLPMFMSVPLHTG